MSPFNAEQFMQTTTTGPLSTSVKACPEGEFRFMVDDGDKTVTFKEIVAKQGPNAGQTFTTMEILCVCLDDAVKTSLARDKVVVPIKMFLDLTEAGTLDIAEGKNVKLGRLRDTLGQNDGSAWSPAFLKGKGPFIGKVTQRSDPDDPSIKYAEIVRMTKIS